MAEKWHVNSDGNPGRCGATIRCPFGGEADHYGSADEARQAYEEAMSAVPELAHRSHRRQGSSGMTFVTPTNPADLAVFNPALQTVFNYDEAREKPALAMREMAKLDSVLVKGTEEEQARARVLTEAMWREVNYSYLNDRLYRAQADSQFPEISEILQKRENDRFAAAEEPLSPEEEEAAPPDPARADMGVPQEYERMTIEEIEELIWEDEQERRYWEEEQEWLQRNKWRF